MVLGIIDSAGQFVVKYKYAAYGKVTITKDTDGLADVNPFKYKGYYFDLESGMYYCHTRYYVPEWGRWLIADSPLYTDTYEFDKLNFFTYCGNSPILRVDIEGQDWEFWSHLKWRAKNAWDRLVNNVTHFVPKVIESVQAVIDSFVFEAGIGVGYGVEAKIGSVDLSVVSRTDLFSFKGDQESTNSPFGTRQVASVGLTWRNYGKSFVFRDYYESYDGHVAEHSGELSSFFGIGASAYLGIGANISIGFNLNQIVDSLNTIWGY